MSQVKRQQQRSRAQQAETTAEIYARRHGTEAQSGRLPFVAMKARMAVQQGYKTGPSSTSLPHTQSLPHSFMSATDTLAYAQATVNFYTGKRENELQPYCAGGAPPRMRSVSPVRRLAAVMRKRRPVAEAEASGSDTEVEEDAMDVEMVPASAVTADAVADRLVKPLRRGTRPLTSAAAAGTERMLQATQSAPLLGDHNEVAQWLGNTDF